MGKTYKQEAARIAFCRKGKKGNKKVANKLEFMDKPMNSAGMRHGNDRKAYAEMKVTDRRLTRRKLNRDVRKHIDEQ